MNKKNKRAKDIKQQLTDALATVENTEAIAIVCIDYDRNPGILFCGDMEDICYMSGILDNAKHEMIESGKCDHVHTSH